MGINTTLSIESYYPLTLNSVILPKYPELTECTAGLGCAANLELTECTAGLGCAANPELSLVR